MEKKNIGSLLIVIGVLLIFAFPICVVGIIPSTLVLGWGYLLVPVVLTGIGIYMRVKFND